MKKGLCPKCGSSDIYSGAHVPVKRGNYGSNTIPLSMGSAIWSGGAALDNYVCGACGYVESYIADAGSLREIRRKWPRVNGQP